MRALDEIIARALARPRNLSPSDLETLVSLSGPSERERVYAAAYELKCRVAGRRVSLRGLVELGNVCAKDCFYCGIRKSNVKAARYRLEPGEVEALARRVVARNWASLVLQGGEIEGEENAEYVEECLRRVAPLGLGVTLSLGEQTEEVYRRWKAAGASRYLLRMETSNPELYARLHPASHSWARRVECLRALRRCGYQVGTGTMSALPGQTAADLARDVVFFGEIDADMIGMGPYLPHPDTPLGASAPAMPAEERLRLGLNMIAATRLYLHDVNVAATTALQTLAPDGRRRGILAGANVMMPNVTDSVHARDYRLYEGKPGGDEDSDAACAELERSLAAIGETVNYGRRGDSAHFAARVSKGGGR